jgi:hypothetical protein
MLSEKLDRLPPRRSISGLVQNIPQGTTTLRIVRPTQATTLVGNFSGYTTEPVTLTPLPSAPPPETFLAKLAAHSVGIRINFTRGGVGDPKTGGGCWRIATYVASKTGTDMNVTGWYPLDCFSETNNTCPTSTIGGFMGREMHWDQANQKISIFNPKTRNFDIILNYDIAGTVSDAHGPAGYISFDP